ncbi:MAG: hypothetical protein RJQ14_14215, partial [Marinoscillum sp.]
MSCEDEARQFDFSKKLMFTYSHERSVPSFDSLGILSIVDNDAIEDYKDYADSYKINEFSYQVINNSG